MSKLFENKRNGIFYLANVDEFDTQKPVIVCVHGNSSIAETFGLFLGALTKTHGLQAMQGLAVDLPGCGRSDRLEEYTMKIVGERVSEFIKSFGFSKVFMFGHSLGGHLLGFITCELAGIAIAGTPPISKEEDCKEAFKPGPAEMHLLPMLWQDTPFTAEQAREFVGHTGVQGETLELMIEYAQKTDGKFRPGCLKSIPEVDQLAQIEKLANNGKSVVIFHAKDDGVINPEYLETINKTWLFENKIHYLDGKHMSPISQADKIAATLKVAFV